MKKFPTAGTNRRLEVTSTDTRQIAADYFGVSRRLGHLSEVAAIQLEATTGSARELIGAYLGTAPCGQET